MASSLYTVLCDIHNNKPINRKYYIIMNVSHKFDYCVGNPPYQNRDNLPIFQNFQILGTNIAVRSIMIYMASRWWYGTNGLGVFRSRMLNDKNLYSVYYYNEYESSKKIFGGTGIAGGVNIVLFNGEINNKFYLIENSTNSVSAISHGDDEYLPIRSSKVNIAVKILSIMADKNIDTLFNRKEFITNEIDMTGVELRRMNPIRCSAPLSEYKDNYIIYANLSGDKSGRSDYYIISKPVNIVEKYKVCIGQSIIENERRNLRVFLFTPNITFGRSAMSLAYFDTMEEAINFRKYVTSNFFEYCLRLSLTGRMKTFGYYVPDFKSYHNNSTINWDKNIDEQLYKLFKLSHDEISLIEEDLSLYR